MGDTPAPHGPPGSGQPDDAPWLDPAETAAWRGWLRMTGLLAAELGRELERDAGLSLADYEVLVHLSEAERHELRMSELASRMLWSRSRLSHQVARMAERGLVERRDCPSDARGTMAVLTRLGYQTIVAAAPGHVAAVRRLLFDPLDRTQVEALATITAEVVRGLAGSPAERSGDCPGTTPADLPLDGSRGPGGPG